MPIALLVQQVQCDGAIEQVFRLRQLAKGIQAVSGPKHPVIVAQVADFIDDRVGMVKTVSLQIIVDYCRFTSLLLGTTG